MSAGRTSAGRTSAGRTSAGRTKDYIYIQNDLIKPKLETEEEQLERCITALPKQLHWHKIINPERTDYIPSWSSNKDDLIREYRDDVIGAEFRCEANGDVAVTIPQRSFYIAAIPIGDQELAHTVYWHKDRKGFSAALGGGISDGVTSLLEQRFCTIPRELDRQVRNGEQNGNVAFATIVNVGDVSRHAREELFPGQECIFIHTNCPKALTPDLLRDLYHQKLRRAAMEEKNPAGTDRQLIVSPASGLSDTTLALRPDQQFFKTFYEQMASARDALAVQEPAARCGLEITVPTTGFATDQRRPFLELLKLARNALGFHPADKNKPDQENTFNFTLNDDGSIIINVGNVKFSQLQEDKALKTAFDKEQQSQLDKRRQSNCAVM